MSTTNEASSVPNAVATADTTEDSTSDPTITGATTAAAKKSKTPSDFLKSILGRPIRVKLNSGIEYRGVLGSLDGYLNIAIEQTEEYSTTGQLQAKYGDCFIRGNNGTCISIYIYIYMCVCMKYSVSIEKTHTLSIRDIQFNFSIALKINTFVCFFGHSFSVHPSSHNRQCIRYIYILYTLIVMYISTPPQR